MNLFDCETIHINKIYSVEKYSGFAKLLSTKEYGTFLKTYEIKLDPQITDIRALLEESMISFAGQLEKRGITPEISLPEGPLYRTVDRYAVSRVFGNIISNAVKYSDGDLSVLLTADNSVSTRIKTLTPCFQKKS